MNLLAIDTSTDNASVALLSDNDIATSEQSCQKTHAKRLLPMIDELLQAAGLKPKQLDGIVFGSGPGSFTGLRIACSVAKGLAFAHNLPLFPVSSLLSIVKTVRQMEQYSEFPVLAVLDARMHELYWNYYPEFEYKEAPKVGPAQSIVVPEGPQALLAGVGIDLYSDQLTDSVKSRIARKLEVYPSAKAMIQLVLEEGIQPVPLDQAQPVYVRNHVTQGS